MEPFKVKVRKHDPQTEKPNQSNAAKVFVNPRVLLENGLGSGKRCIVERLSDGAVAHVRREAVFWAGTTSLGKDAVLLSESLRTVADLRLENVVQVSHAGDVPLALQVVVQEVTPGAKPFASVKELHTWESAFEYYLQKADYVFPGLQLEVPLIGQKRAFQIVTVNSSSTSVAKVSETIQVEWAKEHEDGALEVKNIPGMEPQLRALNYFFSCYDEQFDWPEIGEWSCGIVVQGSTGTGKSLLLDRIAATKWGKVVRVKQLDKSTTVRYYFEAAVDSLEKSMILIDDFQDLAKDTMVVVGEGLKTLVAKGKELGKRPNVLVVATCNSYLDDIPSKLRSEDCFDDHVDLRVPDVASRGGIIRYLKPRFPPDHLEQYVSDLAEITHAYTGRDLRKLMKAISKRTKPRAGDTSLKRRPAGWDDVQQALTEVRPTAIADITLKPPTVRWDDIGGYNEVKKLLQDVLTTKRDRPLKGKLPKGTLLYGPPGCSKTMTAQAVATESSFNFFCVKGAELLNMYVGETERSIRNLFQRAHDASPSVIFFDEIDAIAGSRTGASATSAGGSGGVQALTTLLTEMDGFEQRGNVFVLAATNRPESLDSAMLRPGRFDRLIFVPLPDAQARGAILARKIAEYKFCVDVDELVRLTEGYSGAEITGICDNAFLDVDGDDSQDDLAVLKEYMLRKVPRPKHSNTIYEKWARNEGAFSHATTRHYHHDAIQNEQ